MKNIKKTALIASLSILVLSLASCGEADKSPFINNQELVNTYTVKFYNYTKTEVLYETKVKEHETVEYILSDDSLARTEDVYHTYTFKNWVELDSNLKETKNYELKDITKDTSFAPVYEQGDKYYNVTFYADEKGTQILEQYTGENAIKAGSKVTCSKVPTKENSVKFNYTFKYWDKKDELSCVLKDLEVYPVFDYEINKYTVTFYADEDGNEILEQYAGENAIVGGESVTCTKIPVKENTLKYSYSFKQWDKKDELKYVDHNLEVYPIFEETINKYNVIFYANEEGTEVLEEYVDDNAVIGGSYVTCSKVPTKEKDKMCTYAFKQWDKKEELKCVTSDLEVYPIFSSTLNKYSYAFYDYDGTLIYEAKDVDAGTKVVFPETEDLPTRATEEYEDYKIEYTFDSWSLSKDKFINSNSDMNCLLDDIKLYATYKSKTVKSDRLQWIEHLKEKGTTLVDEDYYYVNINSEGTDQYYIGFNTNVNAKKFNLHTEIIENKCKTVLDYTFEFKTNSLNGFINGSGKVLYYKVEGNSTDSVHNVNFEFNMKNYNKEKKSIGEVNVDGIVPQVGENAILDDESIALYKIKSKLNCESIMLNFRIFIKDYCNSTGLPFIE